MEKHKIIYGLLTLSSVFALAPCGGKDDLQENILDGEYITNENLKTSSSNKGYLALKVKLKNNGGKSILW
ncbi:hypothetical protein P7H30_09680 [Streptococcus parauberis]|uniref:hypothetical protein n=1 Tax=Streptococcus parauberis TaxID=1348 RepID=UPI00288F9C17|nr:hypothetical protein [Streptococcus parauberis]MDT2749990.1 hypothetical protein [Streptococcus parauberis]